MWRASRRSFGVCARESRHSLFAAWRPSRAPRSDGRIEAMTTQASHSGSPDDGGQVHGAIPVSVIVMTKNEQTNLAKCLRALERCAEVFVVDSASTDNTVDIASAAGARVVHFEWDGQYPKKKQWCLDNLPFSHSWVLYVDADEELSAAVANEIADTLTNPGHAGYFVGYDYVFMDSVLRHGRLIYKLVLMDRHRAHYRVYDDLEAANAGEVELHFQPVVDGSTGTLRARMVHDDHQTLFNFFARHNRYSDWEAVVQSKPGRRSAGEANAPGRRVLKAAFDLVPGKPLLTFLYSYVLRSGFRDGRAGFHYAVALAFYVWQIQAKRAELENRQTGGLSAL